jgi:hypothetical protein
MSTNPAPRRIEWAGPESWVVWTDEDGTHLKSARGDSLEMPDVERLFSLWQHARAMSEADHIPAPQPPSRDEVRAMTALRNEEYLRRRAIRAINTEFNADTTAPF